MKPSLLRYLLQREDVVTYLDPDIEVFSSLQEIPALAIAHGVVPHPPHDPRPYPTMAAGRIRTRSSMPALTTSASSRWAKRNDTYGPARLVATPPGDPIASTT